MISNSIQKSLIYKLKTRRTATRFELVDQLFLLVIFTWPLWSKCGTVVALAIDNFAHPLRTLNI